MKEAHRRESEEGDAGREEEDEASGARQRRARRGEARNGA